VRISQVSDSSLYSILSVRPILNIRGVVYDRIVGALATARSPLRDENQAIISELFGQHYRRIKQYLVANAIIETWTF